MTPDLLLALLGFTFATSVTPGPNNMMLLASGVNFGLRRSLPHMLGISLGHALMLERRGIRLCLRGPVWAEPMAPDRQRAGLRLLARRAAQAGAAADHPVIARLGAAAEAMRRILIDNARRKRAARHGGQLAQPSGACSGLG